MSDSKHEHKYSIKMSVGSLYIGAFVLLKLTGHLEDVSWWWIVIGAFL